MAIVTKYTDYIVQSPDWFINYIKTELGLRDVPGLINNVIQAINVSGTHPLVQLTATFLQAGGTTPNFQGILPAVTVVEGDEVEDLENRTMGYGKRTPIALIQSFVDTIRACPLADRYQDGLITDKQLDLIETAIQANDSSSGAGDGAVIAQPFGYFQRETIMISVWTNSLQDRQIIGDLTRSVIYDMRRAMVALTLKDISIKAASGLVNMNFGQILHGMEFTVDFLNVVHNIEVTDEIPPENFMLDSDGNILDSSVNVTGLYRPNDGGVQGKVNISTQEIVDQ